MTRVSPVGFDEGLVHEALVTLRKVGFTPEDLNRIQENKYLARRVVGLVRGIRNQSIRIPTYLPAILDIQVARLIEIEAFKEVRVNKGKYRDELIEAIQAFQWREDLAAIGLDQVALVDYRLSGQFLAEAGRVVCNCDPNSRRLYDGIVMPEGVKVIQAQWGEEYQLYSPRWCRGNFHPLEQGCIIVEGLTTFLYEGKSLIQKCYMDLPGTDFTGGHVPCLTLMNNITYLLPHSSDLDDPCFGSASHGK